MAKGEAMYCVAELGQILTTIMPHVLNSMHIKQFRLWCKII